MNIEKDICKVLSKKEIELMNNDMAHVLVMKFHEESIYDCQKIIEHVSHRNIMYSNSYLMRSMEMSLTMFTIDS